MSDDETCPPRGLELTRRPKRMAECHPERVHEAKGLCNACYKRERERMKDPAYAERERERKRASQQKRMQDPAYAERERKRHRERRARLKALKASANPTPKPSKATP